MSVRRYIEWRVTECARGVAEIKKEQPNTFFDQMLSPFVILVFCIIHLCVEPFVLALYLLNPAVVGAPWASAGVWRELAMKLAANITLASFVLGWFVGLPMLNYYEVPPGHLDIICLYGWALPYCLALIFAGGDIEKLQKC